MLYLSCALALTTALAAPAPLETVAMGSCLDERKSQDQIWGAVLGQKPQAFLFLGDNIYADDPESKTEAYAALAAQPGFKRLRQEVPLVLATWDDHDYGLNDAGGDYPNKVQAQTDFLDFWGIAQNSPRRQQEGIYWSETHGPEGQRVQFIVLDTRYFRSPLERPRDENNQLVYKPNLTGTLLGEAQWTWLEQELREPAEVRVILSSIQVVSEEHRFEKWANLPNERTRLFELIGKTGANGVVVVSGDRHLAELSMLPTSAAGYPIYDLTASAMTQSSTRWRPLEANRWRVSTMNVGNNFGMLRFKWQPEPVVTFEIRDDQGELTIRHHVPLSVLKPREPAGR